MEECTHGEVSTWKRVRTRGRLNTEKNIHKGEYSRGRMNAGEEEYTPCSEHTEESIHGESTHEESTHGEVHTEEITHRISTHG